MDSEEDVVLAKIAIMKKCVATIEAVQGGDVPLWMREDLSVLNLQRSIQAAIDLAHVVIAKYGLGLPSDYGQSFDILSRNCVIKSETASALKKMVGFRNISVHQYQEINGDIVQSIIHHHLDDFEVYYTQVHQFVFNV
ncbi:MAG: hypothetical protein B6I37_04325 [Desulfobacteraceae bacterium 4572_35.2]|nr:MAG: hypothetical protein B6I37_04325 [Desulfobacteraceae bacterium 4572_35.2]